MCELLRGKTAKICLGVIFAFILLALPAAVSAEVDIDSIYNNIRQGMPPEELKDIPLKPGEPLPGLSSRAAIVMDAGSGLVIYERNADARLYPASTTKIMTLIVALEKGYLDDIVTVSSHASETEGSTLWLNAGDRRTLRELLYGMMLVSGNDATVAIAEHIAGSLPAFARLMTERAHELGATHTNFTNSSGLPDDNHYTTARDLALLTAHGYTLPEFEEIVSTKEKSYHWVDDPSHMLRNENQMLWFYEGCNGVKTGYTDVAGRCLVTGAKRHGLQLITVVLDSVYMWNDSLALLKYGFEQVDAIPVVGKGEVVGSVKVSGGSLPEVAVMTAGELNLAQIKGSRTVFEKKLVLPDSIDAPVEKGESLGRLVIYHDGSEASSVELLASRSIDSLSLWDRFCAWLVSLWEGIFR